MNQIIKVNPNSPEYLKALALHQSIIANAEIAFRVLVEVCKELREMKITQQYISLGYETFEDYTENMVGISRTQTYKYINTYEKLGEQFMLSHEQLGITKLSLIANVEIKEDREEILRDNDIENMSVREMQELVEKINKQGEQISFLTDELDKTKADSDNAEELQEKIKQLENDIQGKSCLNNAKDKRIKELQDKLEKAENRVVDVAVQEPSQEQLDKIAQDAKAEAEKKVLENKKKHENELNALKAEYEKKLSEAKSETVVEERADPKEAFKAYFTQAYDSFNRVASYVENLDDALPEKERFKDKLTGLANALLKKIEVL